MDNEIENMAQLANRIRQEQKEGVVRGLYSLFLPSRTENFPIITPIKEQIKPKEIKSNKVKWLGIMFNKNIRDSFMGNIYFLVFSAIATSAALWGFLYLLGAKLLELIALKFIPYI